MVSCCFLLLAIRVLSPDADSVDDSPAFQVWYCELIHHRATCRYQVVLPGAVASTGGVRRERDYDDYTSRREERPPRREHFAPRQEGGRGGGRGRGDGGGRGRGRGDGPKKEKTAEELDGEMDSYFKKVSLFHSV